MNGGVNWTKPQLTALGARGQNLLVAAGAGSGKTAVLVERIIRLLCDPVAPVDVDRLLVVTFTNAAAQEMRRRIADALNLELKKSPSEQLERQLRLLPQAQITTLHSFCGEMLRRHYYLLDLDPEFRIADETEAAVVRQETMAALFEEHYRNIDQDPDFRFLVEGYGGERDDLALQELVVGLYLFARSNPWPENWLARAAEFGAAERLDGDDPFGAALRELVRARLEAVVYLLRSACETANAPGGPAAYARELETEAEAAEALLALAGSGEWTEVRAGVLAFQFCARLPAAGAAADPELKEVCAGLRRRAKDRFVELQEELFSRTPEALLAEQTAVTPAVRRLAGLAAAFGEAYRKAKLARNLVDFADLEHYCLGLLLAPGAEPGSPEPSAVAAELRRRFVEVLVDEYQDINGVQEAILRLVSRSEDGVPNLVVVGDVKQSIYRFRLAEPELFLEKYREFRPEDGVRNRRVDLAHNFRSRAGIIHAVNFVFSRIMTSAVGELEYDGAAALICGRSDSGAAGRAEPVEVHLLERRAEDATETEAAAGESEFPNESEYDAAQREARVIGGIIRRLVDGAGGTPPLCIPDPLAGGERWARYRDIVVLLRATTGKAAVYLEEFRCLEIPAYARVGTGYFQAGEVETILSLLKIIDNPRQDVPLAAVLRSPLVGLRAGELADVRLAAPAADFYGAVTAAATAGGAAGEKLSKFLARIEYWRSRARRCSPADLIWAVYRETGYYDYVGGLPGGAERQANLRALHDRARQYETTSFRGLFRFLRFLELIQEGGRDLGPAPALGEGENVVRIMSIHQSKGLEFPVVILAELGRRFHMSDLRREVLFHKECGIAARYVDPEVRISYPTAAWHALRERRRRENLSEEMRILYVAMTRARERLILVGSAAGLDRCLARWRRIPSGPEGNLPAPVLAEAQSHLDWLVPALAVHPDAGPLAAEVGRSGPAAVTEQSAWAVYLHPFGESGAGAPGTGGAAGEMVDRLRRAAPVPSIGAVDAPAARALDWEYPYPLLAGLPAKVTATEVKRRFELPSEEAAAVTPVTAFTGRPRFLEAARGLSGPAYGAAMHLVLQHVQLGGDLSVKGIREQIARMLDQELFTAAEAAAVDAAAVAGFFAGNLGRRLVRADWVRRELPFYLAVPAGEVYPEVCGPAAGETVLIQGVIDCLFADPGGLVLVDYKTDRAAGRENELAARYQGQIRLYCRAAESILGASVQERYLYLLDTGRALAVE